MQDQTPVRLTAKAVKSMTEPQWESLRDNICRDGMWENARGVVCWMDLDALMVAPMDSEDHQIMMIGIEADGYTHS